ncbi:MFS-type transporter SLC18B1-like [Ptychodera flava]|uniref:MFS-type transporter SLC18B1-like n=1 Tax=Ptychodera flava TaxID=63121 RepID=UPI003969F289
MFGASFTTISYGFLDKIDYEETELFIALACIIRIAEASMSILSVNSSITIIFHQFPTSVHSKVFGTTNMFLGVGLTSGPLLGGFLYDIGGYGLPFYVVGCCLLVTVPISYCVVDKDIDSSTTKRETSSVITLLRKAPGILVPTFVRTITGFVNSFVMPILAIYLTTQFMIESKTIEGVMFSLMTVGYGIGSLMWAWIVGNKQKCLRWTIMAGLIVFTVPVFFMGPCPWFQITPTIWLLGLTLFLVGIGVSVGVIVMVDIMNKAKSSGMEKNLSLGAMVSGIYYTAFFIGTTLGPILGGLFYQFYGFGWTTTIVGFICVGTCIIYAAYATRESVLNETSLDGEDIEINESTQLKDEASEKIPLSEHFPQYTVE